MASFTLTENFGTYQGSTDYVLDGSTANTWRCNSQATAGRYILVASDQLIHVNSVTYSTGQSSEIFGSGTYLQVSKDGSSFEDIGQFNGNTPLTFNVNKDARYIRVYCKSGSGYVSISELAINYSEVGSGGSTDQAGERKTEEFKPASFDNDHSYYSVSNQTVPIGKGSDSTNYARFYLTRGSRAETYFSYSFDTSTIPGDAIIKKVECSVKTYINSTSSYYIGTRHVGLFSRNKEIGTGGTITGSTTAYKLNTGVSWERSDLDDLKIKISVLRGTYSTSSNYYIYFYGATLTVEYELPIESKDSGGRIKISGKYKKIKKIYRKSKDKWEIIDKTEMNKEKIFVKR